MKMVMILPNKNGSKYIKYKIECYYCHYNYESHVLESRNIDKCSICGAVIDLTRVNKEGNK